MRVDIVGLESIMKRAALLACLGIALMLTGLLAGCATTIQTEEINKSGFLKDYEQMKPGENGQAQLVYVNPAAQFAKYDKIIMNPITVYAADKKSGLSKVPKEELQSIIDCLHVAIQTQLAEDYSFVYESGPKTMRLRVAITEARGANVVLNTISSIKPAEAAFTGITKAITGGQHRRWRSRH